MSNACTPILVGVASPVSDILLPSKNLIGQISLSDHGLYIVHGRQKINQSKSAQKIHASKD